MYLNSTLGMFQSSVFWQNFWPNFSASLLAATIFSFVLIHLINKIREPKLEVWLTVGTSVDSRSLNFFCINNGKTGLRPGEIQWHLYFDECFKLAKETSSYTSFYYLNRPFYQFEGMNDKSCLPGSSCLIFSIRVKPDEKDFPYGTIDNSPFLYSLTTIHGAKRSKGLFRIFRKEKKEDFIQDLSTLKRRVFKIKHIDF